MNRKKKILINLAIIILLGYFILLQMGLHFTAISAYRDGERTFHFGPSKIVHMKDVDNKKYILGTYKNYFSRNIVKHFFVFWYPFDVGVHIGVDKKKAFNYSGSLSDQQSDVFGMINDERITKIQVVFTSGGVLNQTKFYDRMFLFVWKSNDQLAYVRGYDKQGNLIYEEKH